ncbi:spore maturation protein A [Clostridium cavendishii DSM 21758]|uniref:Spore maturation protein A n=1 Tax=Clostridium cavendishii DSM 21758 TaxID=1121302 RepID=A0A1M6PFH0_9CLOT|nr:nucleoside recognition domain-containing protein [Clostridium cavendishii]SHK06664.1 spore maturation protein A [Clostridium cavendishii DSM 21758]
MINYIWFILLVFGILVGIFTGNGEAISKAIIDSTSSTTNLILGLMGIMCFWCGTMKVAEKSGLTSKLAKVLTPILKLLFRDASKSEKAMGAIVMNLTANMLGLSNAATPFGIKAMEELDKLNPQKGRASNDMALFLVMNAACIQILPSTIISIRAAEGSNNPGIIIIPAMIATATAATVGILCSKILQRYF